MRFARAEGSKGSNKKELEEPTPWLEMKTQVMADQKLKKPKSKKDKQKSKSVESNSEHKKNKLKRKLSDDSSGIHSGNDEDQVDIEIGDKKSPKKRRKDKSADINGNSIILDVSTKLDVNTSEANSEVKKKKKDKSTEKKDKKSEFIIENGKRLKVFKNGEKKTWFDLPFEENDVMTRYKNMYVKRDMVKVLDDIKQSLKDQGVDSKKIANTMLTKERKAHNKLRVELLRDQISKVKKGTSVEKMKEQEDSFENKNKKVKKGKVNEDDNGLKEDVAKKEKKIKKHSAKNGMQSSREESEGKRKLKKDVVFDEGNKYKLMKNGEKKPWIELPFEENDVMTKFNTLFVKREMVDVLRNLESQLEKDGLDAEKVALKMKFEEKKANNKLRKQLLSEVLKKRRAEKEIKETPQRVEKDAPQRVENDTPQRVESDTPQRVEKDNTESSEKWPEDQSEQFQKMKEYKSKGDKFVPHYEENEMMAKVEDYFILRRNLNKYQKIYDIKVQRIINERQSGDTISELTAEELFGLGRLMKKEKRREQRLLDLELMQVQNEQYYQKDFTPKRKGKPGAYTGIKFETGDDMAKFQGIWVKKDAAQRLEKLEEKLTAEGADENEIYFALKNERRKEERILKREKKVFCFNCRQSGHRLAECPQETATDVCFSCGSTEHMARDCSVRKSGGPQYAHAVCFVCSKSGHISRECPDNAKGLYPHGGSCNECGSVEHLKMNCPDLQARTQRHEIRLGKLNSTDGNIESMDFDLDEPSELLKGKANKKNRVVFD